MGLFLATHGLREPVQVDGVDVLLELNDQAGLTSQQVPLQDLVVLTTRVQLICSGPAHTANKFLMWASVKKDMLSLTRVCACFL